MKGKDSVMARRRRRIVPRLVTALTGATFTFLNRFIQWHQWPFGFLRMANILAMRIELRKRNLHDASRRRVGDRPRAAAADMGYLHARTPDGTHDDLSDPAMGSAGERFGRNVPLGRIRPVADIMTPNPREVSRRLLARDTFKPATILNLLAAAWIQFQVHDWFVHDADPSEIEIPPPPGGGGGPGAMRVARTKEDLPRLPGGPPAFANLNSHWWDGSQIYGRDEATVRRIRSAPDGRLLPGGRIALDDAGGLRRVPDPRRPGREIPLTGFHENWWTGLEMLHTLFAREHNAICAALEKEHPAFSGDQLYATARLVNAALMAKIHTIEWTPAILATREIETALNTNWSGLPKQGWANRIARVFATLVGDDELLEGIPRTSADHHTAPYALTEEFTAVYRMHPLLPDAIAFESVSTGRPIATLGLLAMAFEKARAPMEAGAAWGDLFYSFGLAHPGAITLRNYPASLRDLPMPDGRRIDLGAIDILRDRERGVPLYNDFREELRLPRIRSFRGMAGGDGEIETALREIYGDVDKVDLMVGLFSEKPPEGFGFSDTAFRIFILMASRRLKSDRFFTDDYRPEIYTQVGIDWVETSTMSSVLLRHVPALAPVVRLDNAFKPWRRLGPPAG